MDEELEVQQNRKIDCRNIQIYCDQRQFKLVIVEITHYKIILFRYFTLFGEGK